MQRELDRLIEILSRELKCYTELLQLLAEEKELISSDKPGKLEELVKRGETIVLELRALGEARQLLMRKIAQMKGLASPQPTLTQLLNLLDEPYSSTLSNYIERIKSLLSEIEELNVGNSYLTSKMVEFVDGVLRMLYSDGVVACKGKLICDIV